MPRWAGQVGSMTVDSPIYGGLTWGKCDYCGRCSPLGSCEGCGAANRPVYMTTPLMLEITTYGDNKRRLMNAESGHILELPLGTVIR